jgi:hypothetical protein
VAGRSRGIVSFLRYYLLSPLHLNTIVLCIGGIDQSVSCAPVLNVYKTDLIEGTKTMRYEKTFNRIS